MITYLASFICFGFKVNRYADCCKGFVWLSAIKCRNRAQLKCSRLRPSSSGTTTLHRFCELKKMLTCRSSYTLHNFFRFFNLVNTVNFSMDSTAKFSDIRFQYVREKLSQFHAKPLVREIISSILNTFQNVSQYFRSAGLFFTVIMVMFVYRDNKPVFSGTDSGLDH